MADIANDERDDARHEAERQGPAAAPIETPTGETYGVPTGVIVTMREIRDRAARERRPHEHYAVEIASAVAVRSGRVTHDEWKAVGGFDKAWGAALVVLGDIKGDKEAEFLRAWGEGVLREAEEQDARVMNALEAVADAETARMKRLRSTDPADLAAARKAAAAFIASCRRKPPAAETTAPANSAVPRDRHAATTRPTFSLEEILELLKDASLATGAHRGRDLSARALGKRLERARRARRVGKRVTSALGQLLLESEIEGSRRFDSSIVRDWIKAHVETAQTKSRDMEAILTATASLNP